MADRCEVCGQSLNPFNQFNQLQQVFGHYCPPPDPRIMAKLEEILELVKLTHDHVITD